MLLLVELLFSDLPWPLKVMIVGGIAFGLYLANRTKNRMQGWSSAAASMGGVAPYVAPRVPVPPATSARRRLEGLRRWDPDFSMILFEDFVSALYAHVHYALVGRVDSLSAYLAPDLIARLRTIRVAEVRTVIVGAMHVRDVRGLDDASPRVLVELEIESNVGRVDAPGGPERTHYLRERWTLARRRDAHSRPPASARILACPGCGAPLDVVVAGTCGHCRRQVSGGDFDWVVQQAMVVESSERGPMLTTEVDERGTNLPTIVDPQSPAAFAALQQRDPNVTWPALEARVALVFREFQVAWTARDLLRMRPFFTDALFDVQRYWVEAYRSQHLVNCTDNARIVQLQLARVGSDRFFDAVTVRLYATGLDYVMRDSDRAIVRGSNRKERPYSEYWTFIRGAGRVGPTRTAPECPSCGAPLAVGMAGDCRYCKAKVTTGEFDWVLSRIEQDEAYVG